MVPPRGVAGYFLRKRTKTIREVNTLPGNPIPLLKRTGNHEKGNTYGIKEKVGQPTVQSGIKWEVDLTNQRPAFDASRAFGPIILAEATLHHSSVSFWVIFRNFFGFQCCFYGDLTRLRLGKLGRPLFLKSNDVLCSESAHVGGSPSIKMHPLSDGAYSSTCRC